MSFRSLDLRRHKTQFREHEIIQDRVHDSAVSQEELVLWNLLLPHTKTTVPNMRDFGRSSAMCGWKLLAREQD